MSVWRDQGFKALYGLFEGLSVWVSRLLCRSSYSLVRILGWVVLCCMSTSHRGYKRTVLGDSGHAVRNEVNLERQAWEVSFVLSG